MERTIKIRIFKGSFYGTWTRAEGDFCYIVRVWDGETLLAEKRFEAAETAEQEEFLYTPEEIVEGKEYQFGLEVIAEQIRVNFKVPEIIERLKRLKENILAHATAEGSYVLNLEVMEEDALTALFKEHIGSEELIIQKPNEPEIQEEEQKLYVQGENVQVQFWVDECQALQMTVMYLSTELELFKDTRLEEALTIENPKLCLASCIFDWKENTAFVRGWNYFGELTFLVELNGTEEENAQKQCICFAGALEKIEDGVRFFGKNIAELDTFTILGMDGSSYTLEKPVLLVKVEKNEADVWLEGEITRNNEKHVMRVSLPANEAVDAAYQNPKQLFPTMERALSYVEGENSRFVLPLDFRSIPDVEVKTAGIVWMSPEYNQEMYYLQIGANGTAVTLLPGKLELTDWNLMGRRIEYLFDEKKYASYVAGLNGTFLIADEKKVELDAAIAENADWEVSLKCQEGSWFAALAKLMGTPETEFSERLSFLWKGAELFSLERVYLRYAAAEQKIAKASFSMYMDEPWEIISSVLSLEQLGVVVELTQDEQWNYNIVVDGAVKIGNGDKASTLFVSIPVQKGMSSFTISTAEKGIALPSFEDMLKLVGIGEGEKWIPADFWNLDDIRISKFNITVGLVPQNTVQSFAFGVTTEKTYTVSIGSMEFTVEKLEILLDYEAEKELCFTGNGQFSLFGLEADVQIISQGAEKLALRATLSEEQTKELSFVQLADSFVDTETGKYENLSVPEHFEATQFEKAAVYIEKVRELYLMYGKIRALGQAAFVSVKQETERGYLLAVSLDENFSFAGISSALAVLDSYFKIQNAGFLLSSLPKYNLSEIRAEITDLSKEVFDKLPMWNEELHTGTFLYGTIAFCAPVFSNLFRLGNAEGELVLEAYAYLPKEEGTTEISARINEFLLLKIFKFQDISVCYRIREEKQFDLNGTLTIEIGEQVFSFTGAMQVGEKESHFSVETAQGMKEPLGIPGLELKNMMLQMDVVFPKEETEETTYTTLIGGEVKIGVADFKGQLLLQEGTVKVCSVALEQPLDVDDLFAAIFTSKVWPTGLLKLTVEEGVLYKAGEACTIGAKEYQEGLHLQSKLTLYGFSFGIEGKIVDDTFEITGTAQNAISLGILKITGVKGALGPGIKFQSNAKEKTLGISGGIELFGERLADVKMLGYDMKQKCFKGSIEYSGDVELFKGTKISFTWEEEKGVHIEEFPMQFIDEALDYAKLLETASKSSASECGELAGLAFDKVVKTKFEIEPSFGEVTEAGITIEFQPKYQVFVVKEKILEASMKKLCVKVSKPEEIGFEALAKLIVDTILKNAVSIAEQIVADGDKLIQLITLIGAVEGGKKAFESLVCWGAKEIVNGTIETSKVKHFSDMAWENASGGSLGGAAGAAAGAGAASAGAESWFDGAILFFAGLFSGFIISGGGSGDKESAKEHEAEAEKRKKEAEEAERSAREAVRSMLAIKELRVEEKKAGSLSVSWSEIDAEEMELTYHIVVEENGVKSPECVQKDVQKEITIQEGVETEVKISVYAVFIYPEEGGDYTYTGETAQVTYTAGKPLELLADKLPDAKAGDNYQFTLQAQGGTKPYQYKAHGLPEGLSLQDDTISGIPRFGGGEVLVDITVTDALQRTITQSYWMNVK